MSSCVTGEGCVAAAPLEKTRTTPRVASANERPAPDGKDESRCLVIAVPTITLSSRSQSETAPTRSQYIRLGGASIGGASAGRGIHDRIRGWPVVTLPPTIWLICPDGQVASSTRAVAPVGNWPIAGSVFRICVENAGTNGFSDDAGGVVSGAVVP